ncbi:alpha/beta fold hydrolase [Amycolatopsis taiwanensis]|uniref:Alpha/beta hydrolase n=1 Tax=Amycolatopsis taiwanensis TaxID=342230 RepID=A0A9W6QXP0_9PSEU|nr:alpha/beta hydrolase [Amycolatopsis taiwanensis]GLY64785.1 alpha/beta hydrolase [Amycolatopsis taiwanensis]
MQDHSRRDVLKATAAGTATVALAGGTAVGAGLLGAGTASASSDGARGNVLEVPGAALYYETHGRGPLLLMIPGAGGTGDGFIEVTRYLAARYTVVLYDRRGFSRSQLRGAQDYAHHLATDADDARRLIEYLSSEPSFVFGSSDGAMVALEMLTLDPSRVCTFVPYEPPAVTLLPDGRAWLDFYSSLYDLYRRAGTAPAQQLFDERDLTPSDRASRPPAPPNGTPILVNQTYWFERELRQYPAFPLDLDALARSAGRLVLAVGSESGGLPAHESTVQLARRLGLAPVTVPGGHLGYLSQPAEFARRLIEILARA